MYLKLLLV
jgi:hypothetical protein